MDLPKCDLSICIASYNTLEFTRQCLRSIFEATREITFEVFVVDNASHDGSPDMIRCEYPQVNLISNDNNAGVAAATNQGILASRGKYFLTMNSDTVVQSGALEKMVAFMDANPDVGGITAHLIRPDGTEHPPTCGKLPTPKLELLETLAPLSRRIANAVPAARMGQPMDYTQTQEVPCVWWGTAFMVRRKVLETVGGQDPRFFVYGEDTDWSMRIVRAGWKLYHVAEAHVIHHGGQSTKQVSSKMLCQLYRSRWKLISKHYGALCSYLIRLIMVFVQLTRIAKWLPRCLWTADTRTTACYRISQSLSIIKVACFG